MSRIAALHGGALAGRRPVGGLRTCCAARRHCMIEAEQPAAARKGAARTSPPRPRPSSSSTPAKPIATRTPAMPHHPRQKRFRIGVGGPVGEQRHSRSPAPPGPERRGRSLPAIPLPPPGNAFICPARLFGLPVGEAPPAPAGRRRRRPRRRAGAPAADRRCRRRSGSRPRPVSRAISRKPRVGNAGRRPPGTEKGRHAQHPEPPGLVRSPGRYPPRRRRRRTPAHPPSAGSVSLAPCASTRPICVSPP